MKTFQLKKCELCVSGIYEEDMQVDFVISLLINQLKVANELINHNEIIKHLDEKDVLQAKALQANSDFFLGFNFNETEIIEFTDVFEYESVQLDIAEKQLIIEFIKKIDFHDLKDMITEDVINESEHSEHIFESFNEDSDASNIQKFVNDIILKLNDNTSEAMLLNIYEKKFITKVIENIESVELKNTITNKLFPKNIE